MEPRALLAYALILLLLIGFAGTLLYLTRHSRARGRADGRAKQARRRLRRERLRDQGAL